MSLLEDFVVAQLLVSILEMHGKIFYILTGGNSVSFETVDGILCQMPFMYKYEYVKYYHVRFFLISVQKG